MEAEKLQIEADGVLDDPPAGPQVDAGSAKTDGGVRAEARLKGGAARVRSVSEALRPEMISRWRLTAGMMDATAAQASVEVLKDQQKIELQPPSLKSALP